MDTEQAIPHYRYLIVDDDLFTCKCIASFLTRLGSLEVHTADNGKTAVRHLDTAAAPPDIIICDLNMPEVDGVEYMLHLSQRRFAGGIILISSASQKMLDSVHRLATAHHLNVLGTLTKPIDLDGLTNLIAEFGDAGKSASPGI